MIRFLALATVSAGKQKLCGIREHAKDGTWKKIKTRVDKDDLEEGKDICMSKVVADGEQFNYWALQWSRTKPVKKWVCYGLTKPFELSTDCQQFGTLQGKILDFDKEDGIPWNNKPADWTNTKYRDWLEARAEDHVDKDLPLYWDWSFTKNNLWLEDEVDYQCDTPESKQHYLLDENWKIVSHGSYDWINKLGTNAERKDRCINLATELEQNWMYLKKKKGKQHKGECYLSKTSIPLVDGNGVKGFAGCEKPESNRLRI